MVTFTASKPFVRKLRSDGGFRLELDISPQDYDAIVQLGSPKFDEVLLKVTIEENAQV